MQRDGLLVPFLAVAEYSEEQIGDKDERCADQADDPRIAESRLCRYESGIHSRVRKIPIGTISRDRKAEGIES